jgi:ubiquinol-cytochrome c reductase iron-sulfur subunit
VSTSQPATRDERRIEHLAAGSFVVAAIAAVILVVVYIRGGQPQLEGALLAVAFGGVGVGLVLWANGLLAGGPYAEERESLVGTHAETDALDRDLERGGELQRRSLLKRSLALAIAGIGAALLLPVRSLGPRPGRSLQRTGWAGGARVVNEDGEQVHADDVPLNSLLTVFPKGDVGAADAQAVLVRVDPDQLQLPPSRKAWAPEGLIAYSKVCTHAGCPVGLYQAETHELLCPCHQSAFDVLRGALPLSGPAAWPLPQLPLAIDADGSLRSTGDFSEPVGPGWWKT